VRVLWRDVRGPGDDAVLLGSVPAAVEAGPMRGGSVTDSERAKRAKARAGHAYIDMRGPDAKGARGYRWPSFDEDPEFAATAATRHGVWSKRKVDPLATELVAGLLDDRPDLGRYPETLMAWGRAEARCILLGDWIVEHGLVDADGDTSAPLRYVVQFERLALELRSRLGLDPRSEAELANAQADAARNVVDLDALRARGRRALKARREHESGECRRSDDARLAESEETT
jgi:hypothetical protein